MRVKKGNQQACQKVEPVALLSDPPTKTVEKKFPFEDAKSPLLILFKQLPGIAIQQHTAKPDAALLHEIHGKPTPLQLPQWCLMTEPDLRNPHELYAETNTHLFVAYENPATPQNQSQKFPRPLRLDAEQPHLHQTAPLPLLINNSRITHTIKPHSARRNVTRHPLVITSLHHTQPRRKTSPPPPNTARQLLQCLCSKQIQNNTHDQTSVYAEKRYKASVIDHIIAPHTALTQNKPTSSKHSETVAPVPLLETNPE